jgi:AcrR family transcriptional regulator
MNLSTARFIPVAEDTRPYHHGDLRQTLIDEALRAITESGPAQVSLRDLARRAGVSHAAPTHHFKDKAGLLTAIATEGYQLLAADLRATWEQRHDFLEVGVAYVRFATEHRAHFEVMFRPELLRADDPDLVAARAASGRMLYGPASGVTDRSAVDAGVAAWSLVHGLATLWVHGLLPADAGDDPEALARRVAGFLFQARPQPQPQALHPDSS